MRRWRTLLAHRSCGEWLNVPRITYKQDTKVENACTFKVFREDHTLGNLLCQ